MTCTSTPDFAPGCFGSALTFVKEAPECVSCPFALRCEPLSLERLASLRATLGVRVKVPKPVAPKPEPKAEDQFVPSKKIMDGLAILERKGYRLAESLSKGINPFLSTPRYMRIAFSIGESMLTVEAGREKPRRVGAKAVAMTDTMSVTGHDRLHQQGEEGKIKPIIGCRLRLVDDPTWRKTKEDKKAPQEFFVTWYVLSEKGLRRCSSCSRSPIPRSASTTSAKLSFDDLFAALDDCCLRMTSQSRLAMRTASSRMQRRCSDTEGDRRALSASNVLPDADADQHALLRRDQRKAIGARAGARLPTLVTRPVSTGLAARRAEMLAPSPQHQGHRDLALEPASARPHALDRELFEDQGGAASPSALASAASAASWSGSASGVGNTDRLVDMVAYEWKKAPSRCPSHGARRVRRWSSRVQEGLGAALRRETSSATSRPGGAARRLQAAPHL
jgi:hypothetical protein